MSEAQTQNRIRMELAKIGAILFRNVIGLCTGCRGVPITYGLGEGTSDLIGWYTTTVTPAMVGKRIAIFAAVEVKSEDGRLREAQSRFLEAVNKAGGIGVVARSEQQALELLGQG